MIDNDTIITENEAEFIEQPAGIWHYIRTFCAFFTIITSFAPIIVMTEMRTHFLGFAVIFWFLGVISALLVSPLKFLKFGWTIISRCAIFGWFLLPFPLDLATVALAVGVGLTGAMVALFVCPAIFTIYTYFTDIRYFSTDDKKEYIAIGSAIGTVLLVVGLFFAMNGITTLIEAPIAKNKFDAVTAYNRYVEYFPDTKQISNDVLSNPESSEFSEGGYVCTNVYAYEGKEGFVNYTYTDTVKFEYKDGTWNVANIDESKEILSFDEINGTWVGTGDYWGNLSSKNQYTFTFENLTKDGGSGNLRIYLEDITDEYKTFNIEVGDIETQTIDPSTQEDEVVANLTLKLDSDLVYETFSSESVISEVKCKLSLTENIITTSEFDFGEMVLQPK